MREVLARVVDAGQFDEYKAEYGKTLICGYARIGGCMRSRPIMRDISGLRLAA